jgi:uncharacterized protein YkwD
MNFNYIDAVLVLVILLHALLGWQRGFIAGTLDLVRWVGSLAAAWYFYQPLSQLIGGITGWEMVWNAPLAFIFIVIAVGSLIVYLGALFRRRWLPADVHKRRINRIAGILPGLANGFIMAAILAALLFALPFSGGFQENLRASRSANQLADLTDEFGASLSPIFDEAVTRALDKLTTIETTPSSPSSPDSPILDPNERVSLPYKVESAPARPDLEAEMLELVNRERAEQGLLPLAPDPELTEVARRHSADMFARGYFAHNTPERKDPFERIRESKVRFRIAGENLALAPTLQVAHTGLMNSPGHRANILRPQFGRVGIGILDGGRGRGIMVTQNFRN